jgi:hypothetical protein
VIVSTTLAGPGAEASIVDALRSCAHLVDWQIVLMSGAHEDLVEQVSEALPRATRHFVWYDWPGSYGEARTHALKVAEEFGATWALTVDADERVDVPKLDLSGIAPDVHVLHVPDSVLAYQKPRLIRCGVGARWIGPCCERLEVSGKRAIIPGQFHEAPKTPEQERRRFERGLEHMPAMLEQEPDQPQWRRHYAECLIGVGRMDEGINQFRALLDYPGLLPSVQAWCHYRIAEWEIGQELYGLAFDRCALALARAPGFIQEFGYLLAHLSIKQKHYAEGVMWAEYALNAPLDMTRGGHRSPTWRDGCEGILASARDAQGQPARRPAQAPEFPFEGRREAFGEDYLLLASALIQTVLPTAENPTHLDLGAGNGLLVGPMRKFGVESFGYEASEQARGACPSELDPFMDFGLPLEQWGSFGTGPAGYRPKHDLVSCVEVAEHIPAERADELVETCCSRAAQWIYFSAATPGQGGHGHVNEQPRAYWEAKFNARGWRVDWGMTEDLIQRIGGMQRCWWLKRNALILRKF